MNLSSGIALSNFGTIIVPKLDNAIPLDKFISYAYYPLDSYK